MSKSVIIVLVALVALVVAGIGFDRHRAKERQQLAAEKTAAENAKKVPPLPQWGTLLPEGDNMEVSGSALCGFCHWREGGSTCNTVLQMSTEPGIVFVLPNEKRNEMDKLTGNCAAGDYYITARGTVTQYDGQNFLLVKNFDTVKTK